MFVCIKHFFNIIAFMHFFKSIIYENISAVIITVGIIFKICIRNLCSVVKLKNTLKNAHRWW